MNGKYLLDSNIIIGLFAKDEAIESHLQKAEEVFVPNTGLGELYFGARQSKRVEENLSRLDEFAANNVILSSDFETAWLYGLIKSELKLKGKPIPENDIWIAAIAKQFDLALASRDYILKKLTTCL
ncbi:MAG: type II toxin-antitoxin system VapC family toxin [bacterium]